MNGIYKGEMVHVWQGLCQGKYHRDALEFIRVQLHILKEDWKSLFFGSLAVTTLANYILAILIKEFVAQLTALILCFNALKRIFHESMYVLEKWEWPCDKDIRPHNFLVSRAVEVLEWAEKNLFIGSFERDDYRELCELVVHCLGGQVVRHRKNLCSVLTCKSQELCITLDF